MHVLRGHGPRCSGIPFISVIHDPIDGRNQLKFLRHRAFPLGARPRRWLRRDIRVGSPPPPQRLYDARMNGPNNESPETFASQLDWPIIVHNIESLGPNGSVCPGSPTSGTAGLPLC